MNALTKPKAKPSPGKSKCSEYINGNGLSISNSFNSNVTKEPSFKVIITAKKNKETSAGTIASVKIPTKGKTMNPKLPPKKLAAKQKDSGQSYKRQSLHNSIYKLIKCYEPEFSRKGKPIDASNESSGRSATNPAHSSNPSLSDTIRSSSISNSLSARLSQLSMESLERINSWLTNPLEHSCKNSNDSIMSNVPLSNTEIDILDQCVNDLILFTEGTMEENNCSVTKTPRYSIVDLVMKGLNDDEQKVSVKEIIEKIEHEQFEHASEANELQASVILTKHLMDPDTSESKPDKGRITEITFAGTFVKSRAQTNTRQLKHHMHGNQENTGHSNSDLTTLAGTKVENENIIKEICKKINI